MFPGAFVDRAEKRYRRQISAPFICKMQQTSKQNGEQDTGQSGADKRLIRTGYFHKKPPFRRRRRSDLPYSICCITKVYAADIGIRAAEEEQKKAGQKRGWLWTKNR